MFEHNYFKGQRMKKQHMCLVASTSLIASSSIGLLLHHHFICAELEELYLVNSKKFRLYSLI